MQCATAEGITIVNFGMGSPTAATVMAGSDLPRHISSSAYLAIGKARRKNLDRSGRASGPASQAAEAGERAGGLALPRLRELLGKKQTDPSAQRTRPYFYGNLIVYDLRLHFHRMDSDFDPQREAEAVMLATNVNDRDLNSGRTKLAMQCYARLCAEIDV